MKAMIEWQNIDISGYYLSQNLGNEDDLAVEIEIDESMFEQLTNAYQHFFACQEILEQIFVRTLQQNKTRSAEY
jgi:hypothetical protein